MNKEFAAFGRTLQRVIKTPFPLVHSRWVIGLCGLITKDFLASMLTLLNPSSAHAIFSHVMGKDIQRPEISCHHPFNERKICPSNAMQYSIQLVRAREVSGTLFRGMVNPLPKCSTLCQSPCRINITWQVLRKIYFSNGEEGAEIPNFLSQ